MRCRRAHLYAAMALCWLVSGTSLNGSIKLERARWRRRRRRIFGQYSTTVGCVKRDPAILGTISLDLFAVLLGGWKQLLPVLAKDILHTGPWGLGILSDVRQWGALLTRALVARYPITRRVGMRRVSRR